MHELNGVLQISENGRAWFNVPDNVTTVTPFRADNIDWTTTTVVLPWGNDAMIRLAISPSMTSASIVSTATSAMIKGTTNEFTVMNIASAEALFTHSQKRSQHDGKNHNDENDIDEFQSRPTTANPSPTEAVNNHTRKM